MKFNPLYINLLVSSIILIFMFICQDDIPKKVWLRHYKRILKRKMHLYKDSIKKIKTINEVIDFIERYYKNNSDVIKYEKKILYTQLNNVKSIEVSSYVSLIITLIVTALIAFYSLAGSLTISTFMSKAETVNSISSDIKAELESSTKNDNKIKELNNKLEDANAKLEEQKKILLSDFSVDSELLQITLSVTAFILNLIIITIIINYLHNARTSYKGLCLQVIEDIEKDTRTENINLTNSINLIEKSIVDADLTLIKCYDSLNKTDLFLKNLDNKNKAHLAIMDLKSINNKNKK
jgi:hypothetical protein